MLLSGLKKRPVTLPIDSAEYAEMLSGLIANSSYKKEVRESAQGDMSSTY